jgi:hypothetical protein
MSAFGAKADIGWDCVGVGERGEPTFRPTIGMTAARLRKATLEPPLRYLKQQESSNARHLLAQAIIDCADKGIREPDEKRRCAYEDPDRLNRREA